MIRSFRHRGLKQLYEREDKRRLPADQIDRITRILAALDAAETIDDMNQHTFRLHPLTGDRRGRWSVTVRANWRLTFRFESGDAHDVDYH
ncbi:MAG: type II toxin-antitoxin system RelE/ParE family toxin [Alphaproteobacteria bacterium]|nr:type II toxin-antitoxin system RelE/ParE family toxin [Alphaproteobacteria bacterium]